MQRYIAMWSGPRNISTAMMRAWGNRTDTLVYDEPLYAHYLLVTGHTDHPGYDETIRRHETDWRKVVARLTAPLPAGKTVFYQKHMAHHVLEDLPLDWIDRLTNCFLIRDPREMLLSLTEFLPNPTTQETGLPQQVELFERAHRNTGVRPPVVDAKDVLIDPEGILRALCQRIDVPFSERMLHWPPGPRETDGAWAPYWYAKVYETTSFGPYRGKSGEVPDQLLPVLRECQPLYEQLYHHRIVPTKDTPPELIQPIRSE
jgi:hypothetical protein